MHIVAIMQDGRIFESQSCSSDEEKSCIEANIRKDANNAGVDVEIKAITDIEFETLM
jgi:hypothetical protein